MGQLLDSRNAAMAQRIAALHDEGLRVFAGVGALHAPGPQGLVALLSQRGVSVTRMPFAPEENK